MYSRSCFLEEWVTAMPVAQICLSDEGACVRTKSWRLWDLYKSASPKRRPVTFTHRIE